MNNQSDFRSAYSTQTAIAEIKDFILKQLKDKYCIGAVNTVDLSNFTQKTFLLCVSWSIFRMVRILFK